MAQVSVQAFRSLSEVTRHRQSIDALNLQSRRPCPFSTCEYVETFLAHDEFGTKEQELLFLAAFEEDRLIGYLPLRKHRQRSLGVVPWGRVGVLIAHDTDRPHVIARPGDEARCAQAFYEHLLQRERGWSFLELAFQDAESALLQVPALHPLRHWSRRFENMPISRVALPWRSVPEYLASLTHHQRKNLNNAVKKTFGAGRAEAVSCADPAGLDEVLDLYLGLERRSWKAAARAGIERDPRRVAFFRALGQAHQPMRLSIHLLLVDDLPLSGAVTGEFGGVLHGFEMCFDQDYEPLGCGHVAALLCFRWAFARGLEELNLNGNYAYNKVHFGGAATQTSAVQIYRVGGLRWLQAQLGRLKHRLRPPVTEAQTFNPERRAHETHAPVRPERAEERARVRATLAALQERGVPLERLTGPALEAAFTTGRQREVA